MCKHAVKKSLYLGHVHDKYKSQQMCDKAVLENGGTEDSVSDCYQNQEMFKKRVGDYPHASELVPESFLTN